MGRVFHNSYIGPPNGWENSEFEPSALRSFDLLWPGSLGYGRFYPKVWFMDFNENFLSNIKTPQIALKKFSFSVLLGRKR